jgi:hypothetical protein
MQLHVISTNRARRFAWHDAYVNRDNELEDNSSWHPVLVYSNKSIGDC